MATGPLKPVMQMVGQSTLPDRTEHVWFATGGRFKCCLCGAVTAQPPPYPTPANWTPPAFELPLTDEERLLCPRNEGKVS